MTVEKIEIPVEVNTDKLDQAIKKVERLQDVLEEANSLLDELTSKKVISGSGNNFTELINHPGTNDAMLSSSKMARTSFSLDYIYFYWKDEARIPILIGKTNELQNVLFVTDKDEAELLKKLSSGIAPFVTVLGHDFQVMFE